MWDRETQAVREAGLQAGGFAVSTPVHAGLLGPSKACGVGPHQ